MKALILLLLLFYLIWVYIRYEPKLDKLRREDKVLHIILWYNKYHDNDKVERKYIILF